jgi:hypothetical protein
VQNAVIACCQITNRMLSNTLNTNEVKNAAGTEVEFSSLSIDQRERIFALIGESPSLPHRISIKHGENGTALKRRRRSVVRVDKTVISTVDNVTPVTVSAYVVLDAPVGALAASTEMANVLAELQAFVSTTGAGTTVLFDCTGNGANALLNGGL